MSKVAVAFGSLTHLKEYRTPRAFESYARFFILLVPIMAGPWYASIYVQTKRFDYTLFLALMIQFILNGLFSIMTDLEDPFATSVLRHDGRQPQWGDDHQSGDDWAASMGFFRSLDDIDVAVLCDSLRQQLVQLELNHASPWSTPWAQERHPIYKYNGGLE